MQLNKHIKKSLKIIILLAFIGYVMVLAYLLFFSQYRNSVQGIVAYNIIPFQSISRYLDNFNGFSFRLMTDNFFGNMLAFYPMGLLLPVLIKRLRNVFSMTGIAFTFSFLVECLQFLFRLGAFDVDDMILNTTGAVVGYLTFTVGYKIYTGKK
ncbi:VanZ family protein [Radiobacillus sp. PE A8.2]|uniref:VanZ family protein n=1 Tax=Radiobacillus sp. PE A8.2 TaxID=3380349 RepID=UPI00388EC1E6